jgi:4-phytase/acid phosphatase
MFIRRQPFLILNLIFRLGIALLAGGLFVSSTTFAGEPASELKLVVVLMRHGVRSPLQTNQILGKFAAEPWPEWTVPPSILTPHGRQQMVLIGGYYRARYVAEGLLSGDTAKDFPQIFFRSDNDQRTQETTRALAAGLLPGAAGPDLHALPAGRIDPLFQPVKSGAAVPDRDLAVAAVLGRIGNDPAIITQAYRADFVALEQVLCGPGGMPPPGKTSVLDLPASVLPGQSDHTVDMEGPLRAALQITDALLLEYTEGMPMKDVGWGRMTPAMLTQVLKLHSLYFDLTQGTFYPAQVQASNLADHLLSTIEQSVNGQTVPGALGAPGQKLVVVTGHDTNLVNLGGLLGLNWWLSGTQLNPVLPGGALVLELRQRPHDGPFVVRMYYVSQSLEQIRSLSPLSLASPPAIAPIFIPGCSEAGPRFDAPLDKFEALLHRVIDPKFVVPGTP